MMRRLLLAFAVVAPFIGVALSRFGLVAALAPIFCSHMLLLYATLVPNCQWWGAVLRSFETTQPEIWITIDDGPSEQTIGILDVLDQHAARATFFVIGRKAEKHPHLITEILMRGHEVANHTFSHASGTLWAAGPRRLANDINRCAALLRSTPQRPARFFRAPAGIKNPFVHPVLRRRALQLIGWSIRSLDTLRTDAESVARRVAQRAHNGAIVLLHEGHHARTRPSFHVDCIDATLRELAAAGYRFVIPEPAQLRTRAAGR